MIRMTGKVGVGRKMVQWVLAALRLVGWVLVGYAGPRSGHGGILGQVELRGSSLGSSAMATGWEFREEWIQF